MLTRQAFPHLERFHRENGYPVVYRGPEVTNRSRDGKTLSATAATPQSIKALIDWNALVEKVTVFGDPSQWAAQRLAIFRVLASDLNPDLKGSFLFNGNNYSILAINPLYRSGQLFKYDVLVGFE